MSGHNKEGGGAELKKLLKDMEQKYKEFNENCQKAVDEAAKARLKAKTDSPSLATAAYAQLKADREYIDILKKFRAKADANYRALVSEIDGAEMLWLACVDKMAARHKPAPASKPDNQDASGQGKDRDNDKDKDKDNKNNKDTQVKMGFLRPSGGRPQGESSGRR